MPDDRVTATVQRDTTRGGLLIAGASISGLTFYGTWIHNPTVLVCGLVAFSPHSSLGRRVDQGV